MKKILPTLLLSATLLCGTANAQGFTDTQGHWAQSQIAEAYSYGIVSGTSATTYDPDRSLTGQEFASMIVSAVLKDQLAQQTGGWPSQHIKALEATIIDASMPTIAYESGLSRFEAAQMIGGVLGSQGYSASSIDMLNKIKGFDDLFANYYIQNSYLAGLTMDAGMMSGTSATMFEPERVLTRAEGAVIILNMAKHSLFESSLTTKPSTTTPNTGTTTTPSTGTTTTPSTGTTSKPTTSTDYPAVSAVGSYNIPADLNKDGWVTEEEVMTMLKTIQNTSGYKEGDSWDDSKYYRLVNPSAGRSAGYGCAAFAFEVSDLLFGNTPFVQYTASSFDAARDLKAGDVVHNSYLGHWSIIINSYQDYGFPTTGIGTSVSLASGNLGGLISWVNQGGFYSSLSSSMPKGLVTIYSRYPT